MSWRSPCKGGVAVVRLRRLAIVLLVWSGVAGADPAPRFDPPASVEQAQARYVRGKELFGAKQYAAAAEEFAAAYELDPQAKFLLFNLGVARRMAGSCTAAIEAYRAFLAAGPPERLAGNARVGIERCEKIVASLPPAPPEPAQPEPPASEPPRPASPQPDEPSAALPSAPASPPAEPLALHAAPGPSEREPWYRDRLGDALVGSAGACAIASVALYLLARGAADTTRMPASLDDYESSRSAASQYQAASWITAGVGGALLVGGLVRYATRPAHRTVSLAPATGGVSVVLEGRF